MFRAPPCDGTSFYRHTHYKRQMPHAIALNARVCCQPQSHAHVLVRMNLKNVALSVLIAMCVSACVVAPPPRRHAIVEVAVRPPAPRLVVVPAPRRGYIWAPGFWQWNGR